jgi:hypothetical protein
VLTALLDQIACLNDRGLHPARVEIVIHKIERWRRIAEPVVQLGLDGTPRHLVMACQGQSHPVGISFPKEGAALDVGEKNCYDAGVLVWAHH